jgi:pilus assembly protein Flp/PilA
VVLRLSLKRYWSDERGATAIEYGLVAGIMAVAVIGVSATGGALSALYEKLSDIVTGLGGNTDGG